MTSAGERFTVRRTLQALWEVHDAKRFHTEFVLFGEYGVGHVRLFVIDDLLDQPGARGESLRMLAESATRDGLTHSFRPPPRLPPVWVEGEDLSVMQDGRF